MSSGSYEFLTKRVPMRDIIDILNVEEQQRRNMKNLKPTSFLSKFRKTCVSKEHRADTVIAIVFLILSMACFFTHFKYENKNPLDQKNKFSRSAIVE